MTPSRSSRRSRKARSRLSEAGDAIDGDEERLPHRAFARELLAARRRQLVVPAPPLARFLHPAAFDQAVIFQSIQRRVKRGDLIGERALRLLADEPADFVAVPGAIFDEGEDQEIRRALLQLLREGA